MRNLLIPTLQLRRMSLVELHSILHKKRRGRRAPGPVLERAPISESIVMGNLHIGVPVENSFEFLLSQALSG